MRDLRDRVVVVTGAGSGIGRACAEAFARHGARVQALDLSLPRARETAARIRKAGFAAAAHRADCADGRSFERAAQRILAREGRVDVLVNNAGVCLAGPADRISPADWEWILGVNLWGVIHGVRLFLPGMLERGDGHIVNVASMAGLVGLPMVAAYCASKAAVVGLTESLALELSARGVRVTLVCPAAVRTNVMRDGRIRLPGPWPERIERWFSRFAARPETLAGEIVEAVLRQRTLVAPLSQMSILWWLRRAFPRAYLEGGGRLVGALLGRDRG